MSTSAENIVITSEFQKSPPVLAKGSLKEDAPPVSQLPVSTKAAWIDSVNSLTQNFLRSCKESETHLETFLDAHTVSEGDEQQAKDVTRVTNFIQGVLEEIRAQFKNDVDKLNKACNAEIGLENVSDKKLKQIEEYCQQVINFLEELLRWAFQIITNIVIESVNGHKFRRELSSIFFQQLIEAFQQANIAELINCPLPA